MHAKIGYMTYNDIYNSYRNTISPLHSNMHVSLHSWVLLNCNILNHYCENVNNNTRIAHPAHSQLKHCHIWFFMYTSLRVNIPWSYNHSAHPTVYTLYPQSFVDFPFRCQSVANCIYASHRQIHYMGPPTLPNHQ